MTPVANTPMISAASDAFVLAQILFALNRSKSKFTTEKIKMEVPTIVPGNRRSGVITGRGNRPKYIVMRGAAIRPANVPP